MHKRVTTVLKASRDSGSVAREAQVLTRLDGLGLAVPAVVAGPIEIVNSSGAAIFAGSSQESVHLERRPD